MMMARKRGEKIIIITTREREKSDHDAALERENTQREERKKNYDDYIYRRIHFFLKNTHT